MALRIFLLLVMCGMATGCATGERKVLSRTEKARLHVEIANGALVEGDPVGAMQHLAIAEDLDGSLPELYHSRALAYFAQGNSTKARQEVRKALEIKPNYTDANNTLGKLLIDSEKYEEAATYLNQAANDPLYRDAYKAWTNLGIIRYRLGDLEGANEQLSRAIQASPQIACVAYYYRGHIAMQRSRFREAVKDYDSATRRTCASYTDAQLALGLAYQRNGQLDLARKKYLELQQRYPDTAVSEQALKHLKELP